MFMLTAEELASTTKQLLVSSGWTSAQILDDYVRYVVPLRYWQQKGIFNSWLSTEMNKQTALLIK